jgi:hypothetical protein
MFSPSLQSLLVQAQIEELHRVAHTYDRDFAATAHGVDRPKATQLSARIRRAINRIVRGRRTPTEPSAAIHGVELVADTAAVTAGPRP